MYNTLRVERRKSFFFFFLVSLQRLHTQYVYRDETQ